MGSHSGRRSPRHSYRWFLGDTAWSGVLRCTGIQPVCSVVLSKAATPSISHAWTGEAACVWGTGAANRTRHAYAIGVHLQGRCRPRGYPVPEAARKPARRKAPDGIQPSYGLAKMSPLVRPSSLIDSVSSWRQGSSEAEFPPSARRSPGRRRRVWTFLIQNWPRPAFWLLFSTYRHALTSGLYPAHFWAYARTRTPAHVFPAHMHAHTFPRPVDSSANLLLLFMSISSCCYFSVFSSVCIKIYLLDSHM